jgi:hypothetical protein
LAVTAPNREFVTARKLAKLEFDFHLFKIRRRGIFRGRPIDKLAAAFPGYLFVAARDQWDLLRERCGIARYVHRNLPISTVPSLVAKADIQDILPSIEQPSRFSFNERVVIRGASLLAGHLGVFQNMVTEFEAIILLDWMGRFVPVAVDERDLIRLTETPKGRKRRQRRRGKRARRGPPAH